MDNLPNITEQVHPIHKLLHSFNNHEKMQPSVAPDPPLTWIIPDRMRRLMLHTLQTDNLKAGQRLRPRLRGDHAPEPGDGPGPDVVVLGAGRDEELLREGHLGDR